MLSFPLLFIHKKPILGDISDFFVFFCHSHCIAIDSSTSDLWIILCVCVYAEDSLTSAKTGGGFSFSTFFSVLVLKMNIHVHMTQMFFLPSLL